MLKRFRRYLSPPMVISVIALFAALGGGYAVAFVGSGQLQKGTLYNVPTSYTDVRTLDGIGKIQAKCDSGSGEVDSVRLHNSSGEQLWLASDTDTDQVWNDGADVDFATTGNDYLHFHVFPIFGNGKRPQADLDIGVEDGSACNLNTVAALVLNTEE